MGRGEERVGAHARVASLLSPYALAMQSPVLRWVLRSGSVLSARVCRCIRWFGCDASAPSANNATCNALRCLCTSVFFFLFPFFFSILSRFRLEFHVMWAWRECSVVWLRLWGGGGQVTSRG